jgi:hypothetical protein
MYSEFLHSFGVTQAQAELYLTIIAMVIIIGWILTHFGRIVVIGASVLLLYLVFTNHQYGIPLGDKISSAKEEAETGNSGSFTPTSDPVPEKSSGRLCRTYKQQAKNKSGGQTQEKTGLTCRDNNGDWFDVP